MAVLAPARTKKTAKAGFRPTYTVTQLKAKMPKNAPRFCTSEVMPAQYASWPVTYVAASRGSG